jgi:hypothetical protein
MPLPTDPGSPYAKWLTPTARPVADRRTGLVPFAVTLSMCAAAVVFTLVAISSVHICGHDLTPGAWWMVLASLLVVGAIVWLKIQWGPGVKGRWWTLSVVLVSLAPLWVLVCWWAINQIASGSCSD